MLSACIMHIIVTEHVELFNWNISIFQFVIIGTLDLGRR